MTPLDAAILAALAGLLGLLVYKAATGLHYHWNWSVLPQFLLRVDEKGDIYADGVDELLYGRLSNVL